MQRAIAILADDQGTNPLAGFACCALPLIALIVYGAVASARKRRALEKFAEEAEKARAKAREQEVLRVAEQVWADEASAKTKAEGYAPAALDARASRFNVWTERELEEAEQCERERLAAAEEVRRFRESPEGVELLRQENEAIVKVLFDKVTAHKVVLVAKRRMLRRRDEYGLIDDKGWHRELLYFLERVVMPAIVPPSDATWPVSERIARYHDDAKMQEVLLDILDDFIDGLDVVAGSSPRAPEQMEPSEFERFCADELTSAGWNVRVVGAKGDQGVDLVATKDGLVAVFQCKLYSQPVGNSAVQEVHAGRALYDAAIACVVTNATYTPSAQAAATHTGVQLLHYSLLRGFGKEGGG